MDVAGLVFAALGFVDQAIKTGTIVKNLAVDYPAVGNTIVNAVVRMEAQKYTLELWRSIWTQRAAQRAPGPLEAALKDLWGEEGHIVIAECLGQINVKFGEAHRLLSSIDTDSISGTAHLKAERDDTASYGAIKASDSSLGTTTVSQSVNTSEVVSKQYPKKKRWYRRLISSRSSSVSDAKDETPSLVEDAVQSAELRASLAGEALKIKLSPGAKFKWSLSMKGDLRLLLSEIDDWMSRLGSLAKDCEMHQGLKSDPNDFIGRESVRRAAKRLHAAVQSRNLSNSPEVELKLERQRSRTEQFDAILGPVPYVDRGNHRSLKFPLFVRKASGQGVHSVLIAESIQSDSRQDTLDPFERVDSFSEVIEEYANSSGKRRKTPVVLSEDTDHATVALHIVLHPLEYTSSGPGDFSQRSFEEFLSSQSSRDSLLSSFKRLQMACTIAVSVLHLHETGWIPDQINRESFHFSRFPDRKGDSHAIMHPFLASLPNSKPSRDSSWEKTPFDCLIQATSTQTLNLTGDERMILHFHQLGVLLFELGRGIKYDEVFANPLQKKVHPSRLIATQEVNDIGHSVPSQMKRDLVLEEIEKIPLGRAYRELVRICLEGRLIPSRALTVEGYFQKYVIQRLFDLEKQYSAIIVGE